MAKAFADRPRWQRWSIIGGWGFLGAVTLAVCAGDPKPAKPDKDSASVDLAPFRAAFAKLAAPCDVAQAAVGEGLQDLQAADRYALARDVSRMDDACKAAWLSVDGIEKPEGLDDSQEADLEALIRECKMAFYSRGQLAESLMPVVDGDMRPSVIAAVQEELGATQGDSKRCAAALLAFDPPSVSPTASPAPPASAE